MQSSILDRLVFLYGEGVAHAVLPRIQEMINRHKDSLGSTQRDEKRQLSERDILLITYPDQVQESGTRPLETLGEFLNEYVADLISGVHILPFYPSSSDDGFSVIDYLAVDPAFGDWTNIAQLGQHFDLMFDAVINHISSQSEWFTRFRRGDPAFRDYFIAIEDDPDLSQVVRPRTLPLLTEFETAAGKKNIWTTFSADQVDLNYHNPEVLLEILDALLYYVERGARFIRLDAIAYLWKQIGTPCIHLPQTHAIIQLVRDVLDQVAPGVVLITETNVPHEENISYFGDGTNEAQLVYNFALPPLVLHAFHQGDATLLSRWAQTLSLPSTQVSFFNFLASHDGIGVTPVRGILGQREVEVLLEGTLARGGYVSYKQNSDGKTSPYELNINYLDALSDPEDGHAPSSTQVNRFIAAQAIMLSLVGVPGIYVHSLFGSRGDRAGAEASRIPRRVNRQKLTRDPLERELADPTSLRAQILARYSELLRIRRAHRAFHPNGAQEVIDCGSCVFAVLRTAPETGEKILCLHNVANAPASVRIPFKPAANWLDLTGKQVALPQGRDAMVDLQPYQVVWALQA